MQVGVAYSESVQQIWLTIEVPDDAKVIDAIERSGILTMFPHIDLATQKMGVFGKMVKPEAALRPGDRVEIYYLMHRQRFLRPENRTLRHILVTVNGAVSGSEKPNARRHIDAIRARLLKAPERFAEQALKHSECPTAMNGGLLGTVTRGLLFAELEPAAFAIGLGKISAIVESPLGFHINRCDAIEAESELPLASVREKVRSHLEDTRRRAAQKDWIAGLFKRA